MGKKVSSYMMAAALALVASCSRDVDKDCMDVKFDGENSRYLQELHHVKGVVTKHPFISFGGSYYCVRIKGRDILPSNASYKYPDVLEIYPVCRIFSEKDLGKEISVSGSLYYTMGNPGVLNMIAYVYVLK